MTCSRVHLRTLAVLFALTSAPCLAWGESATEVDSALTLELGIAGERDIKSKSSNYGLAMAAEITSIEHWLELEFGITLLNTAGRRELGVDFLFKKPFRLSETTELMIGMGPTITRKLHSNESGNSVGGEVVLELMFWPTRNVGWYLEPSYGFGLGRSRGERSLGASSGLLIGWP